jgi:hypothetical protein
LLLWPVAKGKILIRNSTNRRYLLCIILQI